MHIYPTNCIQISFRLNGLILLNWHFIINGSMVAVLLTDTFQPDIMAYVIIVYFFSPVMQNMFISNVGRIDTHSLQESWFFISDRVFSNDVFSFLASRSILLNSLWASARSLCVFEYTLSAWKRKGEIIGFYSS